MALLLLIGGGIAVFRTGRAFHPDVGLRVDLFPVVLLHAIRLVLVPVAGFTFVIDAVSGRKTEAASSRALVLMKFIILLALIGLGSVAMRQAGDSFPLPQGALALRVRPQTLISFDERSIFVSDVDGLHLRGVVVYDPLSDPVMQFVEHATLDPFREQISVPDLELTLRLSDASDGFLEVLSPPAIFGFLTESYTAFLRLTDEIFDSGLVLYLLHVAGIGLTFFAAWLFARGGIWPLPNFVFGMLIIIFLPAGSVLLSEMAAHELTRQIFTPAVEPFFAPLALITLGMLMGLAGWIRGLVYRRADGRGVYA